MLTYLPTYHVLICCDHRYAVYGLNEHLKRHHKLPAHTRRELLAAYHHLYLLPPNQVPIPEHNSAPLLELGKPVDAFACCYQLATSSTSSSRACTYISISRKQMQQHLNQQHSIKLTRWTSLSATSYSNHAAQLWKPVKAQTFFRERRYLRYFVVQQQQEEVKEKEEEQEQEQNNTQSKQIDVQQRTASLSSHLEAIQARDSQATSCILEEATAHDRTGWFKRTS
jgi:hypothetical protein